ncbi:hypothetical protein C2E23DRAFT_163989 [Lenzites betulinus]|nr:hypothetical protein C2E23DRAFT_163989 [Lenzites betulinus]
MNNGPPSSQASGTIFRDSAAQSLRIFVEASDLLNRPKLVYTLKSNGATISHSPAEASIILIDPQTPSGTQFIQEWGQEPGKAILDAAWVQKSVERGRAFLSPENWGGFCVSGNASETVQESPLPTPRDTPPDAQTSHADPAMQNSPPKGFQIPPGPPVHGYPFSQPLQQPPAVQQIPAGFPGGSMLPGQPNPNPSVVLPAQLVAQLMGLVAQQGMNPASLGMAPMLPQMAGQMGMPQGYPQQPMQFVPQQGMYVQPQYSLPQQQGMYLPQHTMGPPMSHMQTSNAGSPSHYQSPTPASPSSRSSISQARRQSNASDTARDSPMDDIRPTSHKRKSVSADQGPASLDRRAGKGRANDERSAKHRRISNSVDETLPYPDSSPSQPRREASSSRGKLFADEDGEPYKFFVQIDIRPRTKIADAIKKNGGKLVPDIADADYVILGSPSTRTFEERLQQARNYNKLAVRPQWVFQCVEQAAIVEFDDFLFEGFTIEKKRGRPSASGKRFIVSGPGIPSPSKGKEPPLLPDEDQDMAEEEEEEEVEGTLVKKRGRPASKKSAPKETVKKEKTKEPVKGKAMKKADKTTPAAHSAASQGGSKGHSKGKSVPAKPQERSATPKRLWRPSPPPPTRVVEHVPGKNMYTKDDSDYVDEYLPILYFRDPDMTLTTVSEKLHQKMPHHTQKSWQSHITHFSRRDKLERIRRQAHIARRKADSEGQRQSEPLNEGTSQAEQTPPPSASAPSPHRSPDRFTVLMKFFAGGGADNLDDEEVWKAVHRQHPEVPPEEWEAYWGQHGNAIALAVQELSGVGESSSEAPMQYGDGTFPKPEPE